MKSLIIKPKHLRTGDVIGIISPSAPLAGLLPHRVKSGLTMLEKLGFDVKIGKHALRVTGDTAGTPQERAEDINNFFQDKSIKAIFSFIGGEHSNQILDYLDFNLIKNNPKIFLGYSDTTVLHFAFYTQASLVSFYGPAILAQFAENPKIFPYTKDYFKKALIDSRPIGKITPSPRWTEEVLDWFKKEDVKRPRITKKNKGWQWLKDGKAEGPILGGCISSMMNLCGNKYWPDLSDSIFFWENPESVDNFTRGESLGNISNYLANLELYGIFKKIKGMIIGRPFGYTKKQITQLIKIINDQTKDYNFPILFNVDVGHTDPMITIPLGIRTKINSYKNIFELAEKGTL